MRGEWMRVKRCLVEVALGVLGDFGGGVKLIRVDSRLWCDVVVVRLGDLWNPGFEHTLDEVW